MNNNKVSHGSAMPIPSSCTNRARRTGIQSQQMRSAMEQSTWNCTKRDRIDDLKLNAPYNKWNSFFSTGSCDEIFQELTLGLKCEPNTDFSIHPTNYRIRGRKFTHNFMCEFQIEMFNSTPYHPTYPNHILVEFQRRNGDGFVFQQFLHSMFTELRKTNLISFTKFPMVNNTCCLSPKPLEYKESDERKQSQQETQLTVHPHKVINDDTLKMLLNGLFGENNTMCRSAAAYLANNTINNGDLIADITNLEPHIMTKLSDLLLKCVDPQIVRSIGCILYHMMTESDTLRNDALRLDVKRVFETVHKRWSEPIKTRYGSNNKHIICVIPSMQVAQRMSACIEVLE